MEVRIGQILVAQGALTKDDVAHVLEQQRQSGEPFGLICERSFGLDPSIIESAWADQYATLTEHVDLNDASFDPSVQHIVSRRQAWQFRVVPIRLEGHELMMATSQEHLARALRFATMVIGRPVYLVVTDPESLGNWLCQSYPLPGMSADQVRGGFDDLLQRCRMAGGTQPAIAGAGSGRE